MIQRACDGPNDSDENGFFGKGGSYHDGSSDVRQVSSITQEKRGKLSPMVVLNFMITGLGLPRTSLVTSPNRLQPQLPRISPTSFPDARINAWL